MQFTLVILIVFIPSVISLKCYVCNSNENTACVDGGNLNRFIPTCSEPIEPCCRKTDQTVDKQSSIVRTCGSKIGAKPCYKTAGGNDANVCSCNEDPCNHGISLNPQQRILRIILSIITLAITMIILR